MSWLARLDARARHWPQTAQLAYTGTKWLLIALGVFLAFGLAFRELQERRVGLGTGIAVAVTLGVIKGVLMARHR